MEAASSSETSVNIKQTTRNRFLGDSNLHNYFYSCQRQFILEVLTSLQTHDVQPAHTKQFGLLLCTFQVYEKGPSTEMNADYKNQKTQRVRMPATRCAPTSSWLSCLRLTKKVLQTHLSSSVLPN